MSTIRRGSTPYHRFGLPIAPSSIDEIYITYKQGDIRVEKSKEDMEFTETTSEPPVYKVIVHLTQEDTLKFRSKFPSGDAIEVQVDIKTVSSERFTSIPIRLSVGKVLKEEVI